MRHEVQIRLHCSDHNLRRADNLGSASAQDQRDDSGHKHYHYKLVDVGTFGGPASFIEQPFNAVPALNGGGIIVGGSATPVPTSATSNFFICGGLDGLDPKLQMKREALFKLNRQANEAHVRFDTAHVM